MAYSMRWMEVAWGRGGRGVQNPPQKRSPTAPERVPFRQRSRQFVF